MNAAIRSHALIMALNVTQRHGLSLSSLRALCAVHASSGSLKMSALASALGISSAAITGMIDRLEKLGLIARREDPRDRRVWWLDMTAAGENAMESVLKHL